MVRLVFRPYTQLRQSICTSELLRTSTRVSSGFVLARHSSPSFGSQRRRSQVLASGKDRVRAVARLWPGPLGGKSSACAPAPERSRRRRRSGGPRRRPGHRGGRAAGPAAPGREPPGAARPAGLPAPAGDRPARHRGAAAHFHFASGSERTLRLAPLLDSLVRVSRRVGWETDSSPREAPRGGSSQ